MFRTAALAVTIAACWVHGAQADPLPPPPPPPQQSVWKGLDLWLSTNKAAPGTIQIINGKSVLAKDWPSHILIRRGKQPHCTAALVGPRVVLTAAHCLDRPGNVGPWPVRFRIGNFNVVPATCTLSPDYLRNTTFVDGQIRNSADYALCLLEVDIKPAFADPNGQFSYETIETMDLPIVNAPVLLTGYGCTKLGGPPVEALRAGDARVSALPSVGDDRNNLKTASTSDDTAAICPGDSGGPLFGGATLANQIKGERRIIGVNSTITPSLTSRFSATSTSDFRSFASIWAQANSNPVICGVNRSAGAAPCRS